MSSVRSVPRSPSGGPPNHAPHSLAAILERQQLEPQIHDWRNDSNDLSFTDRVAARVYFLPGSAPSSSIFSASHRSSSSMALTAQSSTIAGSTISGYPPTLRSDVSTLPDGSVGTSLASLAPGFPLLQEGDEGVLVLREPVEVDPIYKCVFYFLRCNKTFQDENDWKTHCLSHFRCQGPPRSVSCPLCDEFKATSDDGREAWEARMNHLAQHLRSGHDLATCRPDFHLFTHLWNKRIISDAELQELKGGGQLPRYTLSGGPAGDDRRRDRDERRRQR